MSLATDLAAKLRAAVSASESDEDAWAIAGMETFARAADELEALDAMQEVRRVRLRPDDSIVLTAECSISPDMAKRIKEHVQAFFGESRRVLVLGDGLKLSVLGPDEEVSAYQFSTQIAERALARDT